MYLNNLVNIEHGKVITKLRLRCSKLQTHCFLSKNETDKCEYCSNDTEDLTHFLINCPEYNSYRNNFFKANKSIGITFQLMPVNIVISTILNLKSPIKSDRTKFQNFCIEFIEFIEQLG